jgi:hypothetical protein
MSTARKCLLTLRGELLTPMMQGTVGYAQIPRDLRHRFLACFRKLDCFYLKLSRKCALRFLHDPFPFCVGSTPSSLPSTSFWVKTTPFSTGVLI